MSAEVAPRKGYSELGILCLFVDVCLQNGGGNDWRCVCSRYSPELIKGNEAYAAYPPICPLKSFKAEIVAL